MQSIDVPATFWLHAASTTCTQVKHFGVPQSEGAHACGSFWDENLYKKEDNDDESGKTYVN
jgi:hypothetical protein